MEHIIICNDTPENSQSDLEFNAEKQIHSLEIGKSSLSDSPNNFQASFFELIEQPQIKNNLIEEEIVEESQEQASQIQNQIEKDLESQKQKKINKNDDIKQSESISPSLSNFWQNLKKTNEPSNRSIQTRRSHKYSTVPGDVVQNILVELINSKKLQIGDSLSFLGESGRIKKDTWIECNFTKEKYPSLHTWCFAISQAKSVPKQTFRTMRLLEIVQTNERTSLKDLLFPPKQVNEKQNSKRKRIDEKSNSEPLTIECESIPSLINHSQKPNQRITTGEPPDKKICLLSSPNENSKGSNNSQASEKCNVDEEIELLLKNPSQLKLEENSPKREMLNNLKTESQENWIEIDISVTKQVSPPKATFLSSVKQLDSNQWISKKANLPSLKKKKVLFQEKPFKEQPINSFFKSSVTSFPSCLHLKRKKSSNDITILTNKEEPHLQELHKKGDKKITSKEKKENNLEKEVYSKENSFLLSSEIQKQPVILGTGLKSFMLEHIQLLVNKLGGKLVTEFTPQVSHLITIPDDQNHAKRTLKYATAVVLGAWILSYDWILSSSSKNEWLDEIPFQISGDFTALGAPQKARLDKIHNVTSLHFFYCSQFNLHIFLKFNRKSYFSQIGNFIFMIQKRKGLMHLPSPN